METTVVQTATQDPASQERSGFVLGKRAWPHCRLLWLMTLCWFMRARSVCRSPGVPNGSVFSSSRRSNNGWNGRSRKLLWRRRMGSSFHLELLRLHLKRRPLCGGISLPRILTTVSNRCRLYPSRGVPCGG